jgi:serpin B
MKKLRLIIACLFITGLSMACDNQVSEPDSSPQILELPTKSAEVISGSNDFGIDLFTRTAREENGNLMLSPFSASAALTMLLNGCEAQTKTQLMQVLGFSANMELEDVNRTYQSLLKQLLEADPKVNLAIANAIFYREGFSVKQPFLNTMTIDFNAQVKALDFDSPSAINAINKWASDNTNAKIPKVIDNISREMMMFLMNALYFKGQWSSQFDKSATESRPFYLEDGSIVQVPTMEGKPGVMRYYGNGYNVVELPYGRKNFSMVIVVPDGVLSEFYTTFDAATWKHITSVLDNQNEWIESRVALPKFKFEYEKILNDQLKAMGMNDAFIPYVADLSGISDSEIFVSFVKQNTFVEVNEEGTEAAAVTTIGVEITSIGPSGFIIDRPFIFAIRERTSNALLFIGAVANPSL